MTALLWDLGTAYDLFVSLDVLHNPAKYKARGAWTAGMRARLSPIDREVLEAGQLMIHVPLHWIHALPAPKNGAAVLWTLGQTPPAKRLPQIALGPDLPPAPIAEILTDAANRGAWDDGEVDAVLAFYQSLCENRKIVVPSRTVMIKMVSHWTRAEEFGDRYLEALRHYYAVFFEEEEHRIRSTLGASPVTRAGTGRPPAFRRPAGGTHAGPAAWWNPSDPVP